MRMLSLLIVAVLLVPGCNKRSESRVQPGNLDSSGKDAYTRYASGFRVIHQGAYTLIEVTDPWQQSRDVIYTYVLGRDKKMLPTSLKEFPFIKTPVKRVIALSTTHVAMIDQLGSCRIYCGSFG